MLMTLCHLGVCSADFDISAGPHFNYTRLDFNNSSDLEGYMGGVTLEGKACCGCLFSEVDFEGYWNSGPITGLPCERSSLREYFVEWKLGGNFYSSHCCYLMQPYIGFGWNQFQNEQNPQGGSLTYCYDKLFVPIGFMAAWFLDCGISAAIQLEWRPDVYSRIHFSMFEFDVDLENAFRLQIPIKTSFNFGCQTLELKVVPFFDWNQFGEVRESTPLQEVVILPQLTRWNLGLRVLLGYCF